MTEKENLIEKEFKDIEQALRRAAQTAKRLAEQNGTPYVVITTSFNQITFSHESTKNQP
ncbi:hypothetical protein [Methylophilus sp. DW102]|uniref:hypothetical protein n=1 Tax=Methylophilus sp. DW102 TaxID=3095607 RepID=UPI003087AC2E|nr:hypothetical protein MTDW_09680 [Methylophilus sp. DW102]